MEVYTDERGTHMEFMNTLKKNLSAAADTAVKKTTEVTEIAKLTVEIRSQTDKINAVYTEMGRILYGDRKNGTDSSAKLASLAAEVDGLKETVADRKARLAKAQNRVLCPACGAKMKDTANFCSICGEKLPKEEPAAKAEDIPAEEAVEETAADTPAADTDTAEEE